MAVNRTLLEILSSREDVSDYLFHFTKGVKAKETLGKILDEGKLRDVSNKGIICFTEAPLNSMLSMFKIFSRYSSPYYAPYGVAIKKEDLYNLGARPVIYGDKTEEKLIHSSLQWRFEEYNPVKKDFTWLREWRLNKSELLLDSNKIFAIAKTHDELLDLTHEMGDIEFDGCVSDGQFEGTAYADYKLNWKGVSIEEIERHDLRTKSSVSEHVNKQNAGDEHTVSLGGFLI